MLFFQTKINSQQTSIALRRDHRTGSSCVKVNVLTLYSTRLRGSNNINFDEKIKNQVTAMFTRVFDFSWNSNEVKNLSLFVFLLTAENLVCFQYWQNSFTFWNSNVYKSADACGTETFFKPGRIKGMKKLILLNFVCICFVFQKM